MTKKNDENSILISDVLKGLFGKDVSLLDLKQKYTLAPLKKRGDIEHEVQWQITDLEKEGHKVLLTSQNQHGETILVCRLFYGDELDDRDIILRVRIISRKGVIVPDSMVFLIVNTDHKHMQIADIRIEGDRVNRGYGSIVMQGVMKLVDEFGIKYITGWISGVDWDHIDRSEHFYRKHGFNCQLDHENKHGTLSWLNIALGATQSELDMLTNKEENFIGF